MNETIVPRLSMKHSGAYFTPDDLAATLVSWLSPASAERLLDPSCGDGRILAKHQNSIGIEQDAFSAHEAIKAAPAALVHEGDFFLWASATSERFECAAGNPPFIRYQTFSGEVRKRALAFCAKQGAQFSGLSSSWAPFLVATAALLKPQGRMSFVVPAEIGHAPYAAPLLELLVRSFAKVQLVAVRKKLFPNLSEDCWLLVAEGKGGRASTIDLTIQDGFKPTRKPPRPTIKIDIQEWQNVWGRRLRPYLLSKEVREIYQSMAGSPDTCRFGDIASIGIGYVSGGNDFFHLRPSEAKRLHIPTRSLHPTVRKAKALPKFGITKETLAEWTAADEPFLLLRLEKGEPLGKSVLDYLDSEVGQAVRHGYKCRNRAPWYAVPDVQVPDYVMSYMSGRSVSLVENHVGATCTNSLHAIRIKDHKRSATALKFWGSPFVRLSCELEGHALGGGMLKLEPREASRIVLPMRAARVALGSDEIEGAIATLQSWRHYAS